MKYCKQLVVAIAAFSMAVLVSCNKNHYDVDNVSGVNAEGEVLLPLAYKTTTMMNLMERFQIDSLISCADDGSLYYELFYDAPEVVKGSDFLVFDDFSFESHYDLTNIVPIAISGIFDTVVKLDLPLSLHSDYIQVLEASLRSGRFDFNVSTNVDALQRIIVRSPEIRDADGNEMEFDFSICDETFGFDLDGLYYVTENTNSFTLSLEVFLQLELTDDPELFINVNINGKDLALREIKGYLDTFSMSGSIDTTFSVFPNNLLGRLEVKDVSVSISERNLFGVEALIKVDTAMMIADDIEPYSLFYPIPLWVDVSTQMTMTEIFNQKIDAIIQAHGGRMKASYMLYLNPEGHHVNGDQPVSVADTCVVDVQFGMEIPFAFNASDICYYDTATISFDAIELPDLIESLTLDLDITSSLPLNLNGWFYLYDSQTGMITDTLNADGKIIEASYTGLPTSNTISIEITPDRLDNVLHSDRIVMMFEVDTDSRDVKLNAQQELGVLVRGKVKYNGVITDNN